MVQEISFLIEYPCKRWVATEGPCLKCFYVPDGSNVQRPFKINCDDYAVSVEIGIQLVEDLHLEARCRF